MTTAITSQTPNMSHDGICAALDSNDPVENRLYLSEAEIRWS